MYLEQESWLFLKITHIKAWHDMGHRCFSHIIRGHILIVSHCQGFKSTFFRMEPYVFFELASLKQVN